VSQREREVKLAAPPHFRLPPLTDLGGNVFAGPPETVVLDATYFDTEDLRLARSGASLRHRSDQGWLAKLPARDPDDDDGDVLSRDEHQFTGPPWTPPDAAVELVRSRIRRADLSPVAKLRTTRRRVPLHDGQGREVAEVVDDEVEVVDGSAEVSAFRELEVELAPEASESQRSVILARLRSAGAGAPDPTPKLVHALGVRASAPPDIVVPEVDGPDVDAVVRAALADAVAKIVAHDPGVRLGDDPEDVHQARVAARRLRSHLRTFRPLVDEPWSRALRDELRWLGDVLGGVRDADVLLGRLEAAVGQLPEVDRPAAKVLLDELRGDRTRRRDLLLAALHGDRYLALLDDLVEAARRPRLLLRVDDEEDDDVLRGLVRSPWAHLEHTVGDLGPDPADDDLHATRIRAKRARYAAEAVAPAFGKPARAFAKAVTEVQDVLGEHQDAVVASEWLRSAAARTEDEAVGFAAGLLAGLERQRALSARAAWPDAWKAASKKKLRDWL
jgi:CHAD domain-containing protein